MNATDGMPDIKLINQGTCQLVMKRLGDYRSSLDDLVVVSLPGPLLTPERISQAVVSESNISEFQKSNKHSDDGILPTECRSESRTLKT